MEVESRNQKLKEMEAKYKSLILVENKFKYAIMVKLDRIKELKKYLNRALDSDYIKFKDASGCAHIRLMLKSNNSFCMVCKTG